MHVVILLMVDEHARTQITDTAKSVLISDQWNLCDGEQIAVMKQSYWFNNLGYYWLNGDRAMETKRARLGRELWWENSDRQ